MDFLTDEKLLRVFLNVSFWRVRMMRLLFRVSLCLLFLGLVASATPLFAQQILIWQPGSTSTDFNDMTNWEISDTGFPDDGLNPVGFGQGDWLQINSNTGNIATIGGNLNPWDTTWGTGQWINDVQVGCGNNTANTSRLNMTAGNVTVNSQLSIGNNAGSTDWTIDYNAVTNTVAPDTSIVNMLDMSGGAITKNATGWNFNVGTNGGNGMVVMSGGATITNSDATYVGVNSGSKGFLALQDTAYLNNTNYIWTDVGDNGASGTLTMAGQSKLNTGELFLGDNTGVATVIVTGGTVTAGNNGDWYGIEASLDLGRWGGTATASFSGNSVLNVYGRSNVGNETQGVGGVSSNGSLSLSGNAVMNTYGGAHEEHLLDLGRRRRYVRRLL